MTPSRRTPRGNRGQAGGVPAFRAADPSHATIWVRGKGGMGKAGSAVSPAKWAKKRQLAATATTKSAVGERAGALRPQRVLRKRASVRLLVVRSRETLVQVRACSGSQADSPSSSPRSISRAPQGVCASYRRSTTLTPWGGHDLHAKVSTARTAHTLSNRL